MRRIMTRRKRNFKKIIILAVLVAFIGLSVKFELFEREKPQIFIQDIIYTNLQKPIALRITDERRGLKNVKIALLKESGNLGENSSSKSDLNSANSTPNSQNENLANSTPSEITLYNENLGGQKELVLEISLPKIINPNDKFFLQIIAQDASFWALGNESVKNIPIILDDTNPAVNILANSRQIEQGGIAAVVFKARDANLAEIYVENDKGRKFKVLPFLKENHFATLIAWSALDKDFQAFVVAKDKAGNITKERIRYYTLRRKYKESKLNLSDRFLDGKIEDLATQYAKEQNLSRLEKFKFVNEDLRLGNEEFIHKITQNLSDKPFSELKVIKFAPLKKAAKVADFADHRFYSYAGDFVSDSYHMGLDLASVARDSIYADLDGRVIFAGENGIYGINIIIDHGFGIYSLYGHCSSKLVAQGDFVKAGDIIAKTGVSGLALGDHLHFGVLVQGVEVRPEQFMDAKWFESNVNAVFSEAKRMILGEKNEPTNNSKKR